MPLFNSKQATLLRSRASQAPVTRKRRLRCLRQSVVTPSCKQLLPGKRLVLAFHMNRIKTVPLGFRADVGQPIRVRHNPREAGIEIAFPQRDLHLRSIDVPAADALRDATTPTAQMAEDD